MNNYLGNWGNWIGQIADDVTHQLDGSLQNVEHIVRAAVNSSGGPGLASGASGPANSYFHGIGARDPNEQNQDKKENTDQAQGQQRTESFFMGNGGISGPTSPTTASAAGSAPFCRATMDDESVPAKNNSSRICDHCSSKFSLFNRKKVCSECRDSFCSNCIVTSDNNVTSSKSSRRICLCCNILMRRPLNRSDLMALRVKDLQKHLVRKRINSKSCVEKKDLVELIIRESLGSASFSTSAPSSPVGPSAPSFGERAPSSHVRAPVGPVERQSSFPKSYVESSHRREWFEKLDRARERENDAIAAETPNAPAYDHEDAPMEEDEVITLEKVHDSSPDEEPVEMTPVETIGPPSKPSTPQRQSPATSPTTATSPAVTPTADTTTNPPEIKTESVSIPGPEAESSSSLEGAVGGLNSLRPSTEPKTIPADLGSLSAASSPSRRFAGQGLVRLNEIETEEDLHQLSAKQCKDLLAMSRVNFHGVIEKEELLKIVERLWKQEMKAQREKDTMPDQDLCKICWDAAVDCVMLECGHMATCVNCGKQLAECPICRQYVVRVVRIFKA